MQMAAFIDWMAVTHFGSANDIPKHDALPKKSKPTTALNGYTSALKYSTGVIEMWSEKRPNMGRHFVYSGKVLNRIESEFGVSRDDILRYHTTLRGRISRIDFAVDIKDSGIDIDNLWCDLEQGNAKTLSQHSRTQSGGNTGTTLYVGSRKKRSKMVRIYDKAKEVGDFTSDWLRVELELRQIPARNGAALYQNNDYDAQTIISMVRAFIDFPNRATWCDIFNTIPLKTPVGTHHQSDTEKWLLKQVAPALARVLHENPQFYSEFLSHVQHYHSSLFEDTEGAL